MLLTILLVLIPLILAYENGKGTSLNDHRAFPLKEPAYYFSANYEKAREKFTKTATAAGARTFRLPIKAQGVGGLPLSIDIAWFGSEKPRKILLHTSGLHGVEGFAGSAIQVALLNHLPTVPEDSAFVLIHCLNPYGMNFLRRYNESNVDLNRNFLAKSNDYHGSHDAYESLDEFLNPPSPPTNDFFYFKVAYHYLRLGSDNFLEAVASGQYDFPRGLFFAGHKLENGPEIYRDWLHQHFDSVEQIFVIDVHTGLGDFAQESLFHKIGATPASLLSRILNKPIIVKFPESDVVGYQFKGGHCELFRELFMDKRVDFLTQEFGTYSKLKILKALRNENRYHHYEAKDTSHWSKQQLREGFCPPDEGWRSSVVSNGIQLVHSVSTILFDDKVTE